MSKILISCMMASLVFMSCSKKTEMNRQLIGADGFGLAADGEVEDYEITVYQNAPDTNNFWITNIVHTATNEMTIWWIGTNGVTYEAQYATNLVATGAVTWTTWGGTVTGAPYLQIDSNALVSNKFYRVVAPYSPPP